MTDEGDEWGPWIEHDGKGCPVIGKHFQAIFEGPPGEFVFAEGLAGEFGAFSWDWRWFMKRSPDGANERISRVVKYRVRKPRALSQLRDMVEAMDVADAMPAEKEGVA